MRKLSRPLKLVGRTLQLIERRTFQEYGSAVDVTVECEGYASYAATVTLTEDTVLDVELEKVSENESIPENPDNSDNSEDTPRPEEDKLVEESEGNENA